MLRTTRRRAGPSALSRASRCPAGEARGFTLIELLVVVGVLGVAMAVAVPSIGSWLAAARADAGMRQLLGELRAARDFAMTQRRTMEVQFLGTNQITCTRVDGMNRTTLREAVFEYGMEYRLEPGVPDTPDAFGNTSALDFGGPTTLYFLVDGSVVDDTGVPLSGTVFLGRPDQPLTARAVTVLGPTGRVQAYRWNGGSWR